MTPERSRPVHALVRGVGRLARRHPLPPAPRRGARPVRVLAVVAAAGVTAGAVLGAWAWLLLAGSLPIEKGVVHVQGLSASVRIERDDRGIPSLKAANRTDLAFATGFVHAQERLFQMDLLRRRTAGELAELLGPALVVEDRKMRVHRFRWRAGQMLAALPSADRDLVRAYAVGVEAGRKALGRPPWEYLLMRRAPAPWHEEDTLLVGLGMYQILQEGGLEHERTLALMDDFLPAPLVDFLSPPGSTWDAPMLGGRLPAQPIPAEDVLDLRKRPQDWYVAPGPPIGERFAPGSNNWAVSGKRTAHGGAIVANDMHLGLFVPNLWYRAAFSWTDEAGGEHKVVGATLPGTPAMVVGSNTHVAWGFTNTEGDFADLVLLEEVPGHPGLYLTPGGSQATVFYDETIHVNGGPDVMVRIEETIWGPVLDRDARGRRRALRWVAHEPDAVNLEFVRMETARSVEEALAIAPRAGTPAQNLVVADARGNIGWTILGRFPRRVGFDGRRPTSWADGSRCWKGWVPAEDYPRIINPPDGQLWSANNRVVGSPFVERLGLGTYDHGARAAQIRDDLKGMSKIREGDMLAIQLDDRGLFLARWQRLLLDVLTPQAVVERAHRGQIRREVEAWGARAEPASVGFRLVRRFRAKVRESVLRALTAPCLRADPAFLLRALDANVEATVWQLVTARPAHLLPPRFSSWEALLLDAADQVEREVQAKQPDFSAALKAFTQGAATRTRIRHPFSASLGPVSGWLRLDMPSEELPGDVSAMPRVQASTAGASQRMAVSPGREEEGYFHMPCGQSGHPLSPHYRDGHEDWARGRPSPFLPGPTRSVLELRPDGEG
jgi:penicillin amidase